MKVLIFLCRPGKSYSSWQFRGLRTAITGFCCWRGKRRLLIGRNLSPKLVSVLQLAGSHGRVFEKFTMLSDGPFSGRPLRIYSRRVNWQLTKTKLAAIIPKITDVKAPAMILGYELKLNRSRRSGVCLAMSSKHLFANAYFKKKIFKIIE